MTHVWGHSGESIAVFTETLENTRRMSSWGSPKAGASGVHGGYAPEEGLPACLFMTGSR